MQFESWYFQNLWTFLPFPCTRHHALDIFLPNNLTRKSFTKVELISSNCYGDSHPINHSQIWPIVSFYKNSAAQSFNQKLLNSLASSFELMYNPTPRYLHLLLKFCARIKAPWLSVYIYSRTLMAMSIHCFFLVGKLKLINNVVWGFLWEFSLVCDKVFKSQATPTNQGWYFSGRTVSY